MVSTAADTLTPDTGLCACAVPGHAELGPKLGAVADVEHFTVGAEGQGSPHENTATLCR